MVNNIYIQSYLIIVYNNITLIHLFNKLKHSRISKFYITL